MPFEDILKRSLDTLARDLTSALQAERDETGRRAKDVAEESMAVALGDAQAVAEQRGMTAGREEGLAEGRRQGFNRGRQEGYDAGKSDGYRIGKDEGFLAGKGAGVTADAADQATGERLADGFASHRPIPLALGNPRYVGQLCGPRNDARGGAPRPRRPTARLALHRIWSGLRPRHAVRGAARGGWHHRGSGARRRCGVEGQLHCWRRAAIRPGRAGLRDVRGATPRRWRSRCRPLRRSAHGGEGRPSGTLSPGGRRSR